MSEPQDVWFLLVDRRRARLMRGAVVPPGRIHVDQRATVESVEEEHQHGRPSARRGKDGHSYASQSHEDSEHRRRFAARVVDWLEVTRAAQGIDQLVVFADPRLATELRAQYPPDLAARIDEVNLDLGKLDPGELVEHASVRKLFEHENLR